MKTMIKDVINWFGYEINQFDNHYQKLLKVKRYKPLRVKLLDKHFEIADSLSFYYSYQEIFVQEIYKFFSQKTAPFIIDCGANYGTSILYFKTLYPDAYVIGFEADPFIFKLLHRNIKKYELKNIELFNCALWHEETSVNFFSEKADGGRISLDNGENNINLVKIQTKKLSTYLKNCEVDMLKIDIEGAETKVIEECKAYLKNVNNIFIEYHSFKNKKQDLDKILSILSLNNFRYQIHTQFSAKQPFVESDFQLDMDLQLNIFGYKNF